MIGKVKLVFSKNRTAGYEKVFKILEWRDMKLLDSKTQPFYLRGILLIETKLWHIS